MALQSNRTVATAMSVVATTDVIVIGAGSAGLTAAKLAADTVGKSCVLIEQSAKLGGDCTWTGCVPSKSLIAAAKAAHTARSLLGKDAVKVDYAGIRKQLQASQRRIYDEDDAPPVLEALGVNVVSGGKATLLDSSTVRVSAADGSRQDYKATQGLILCTGAEPRPPPTIPGLGTDYLTYESVWALESLPSSLAVVGGGPIGCELAQALSRLGVQVTLIATKLLPREEPRVGETIQQVFESEGIQVVPGRLVNVQRGSNNVVLETDQGGTVEVERILMAIGRVPRAQGMGLEEVGVLTTKNGGIAVDANLQTNVKGIYAAGDCTGDRQFTHYAGYQGAIAARNILLPFFSRGVLPTVPATTFTTPEVASIGLSEIDAIKKYGREKVFCCQQTLQHVDRAVCDGTQDAGFFQVVTLKKGGKVLGATIVAPSAGEMINEIAVVMQSGMNFADLAQVMHVYPTYAFALQLMAAELYYEKTMKLKWLYDLLGKFGL